MDGVDGWMDERKRRMVWMDGWMRGGEETDGHIYIHTYIQCHTYTHTYIHTYIHGWMRGGEETDGVGGWMDETGRRDGHSK